jgi:hypothetical protein
VTAASFHVGETLGRSTPKIAKHLAAIRPAVVTLDAALKPHFKSGSASDLLDKVKSALDKADTMQEAARTDAPGATLTLYEVMGKVVEQIEDLSRTGERRGRPVQAPRRAGRLDVPPVRRVDKFLAGGTKAA